MKIVGRISLFGVSCYTLCWYLSQGVCVCCDATAIVVMVAQWYNALKVETKNEQFPPVHHRSGVQSQTPTHPHTHMHTHTYQSRTSWLLGSIYIDVFKSRCMPTRRVAYLHHVSIVSSRHRYLMLSHTYTAREF